MQVCPQAHLLFIPFGDDKIMSANNEYEDDYYETSEFDTLHFDEEYDADTATKPSSSRTPPHSKKKSLLKKKKRLEDWLEEKRLRDELGDG